MRAFRPEFVEASRGHFEGNTFQLTKDLGTKMRRDPCTRADCASLVTAFGDSVGGQTFIDDACGYLVRLNQPKITSRTRRDEG